MDVELVELVPKNFPEGADRRERSFIFAKAKLRNMQRLRKFEIIVIITIFIFFEYL